MTVQLVGKFRHNRITVGQEFWHHKCLSTHKSHSCCCVYEWRFDELDNKVTENGRSLTPRWMHGQMERWMRQTCSLSWSPTSYMPSSFSTGSYFQSSSFSFSLMARSFWSLCSWSSFSNEVRLTSTSCSNCRPALVDSSSDVFWEATVPMTYCGFSLKSTLRMSSPADRVAIFRYACQRYWKGGATLRSMHKACEGEKQICGRNSTERTALYSCIIRESQKCENTNSKTALTNGYVERWAHYLGEE